MIFTVEMQEGGEGPFHFLDNLENQELAERFAQAYSRKYGVTTRVIVLYAYYGGIHE